MATTTIRLGEDMKARVTAAAERVGKSPHAFILEAITHRVEQAEVENEFLRLADERWHRVLATTETVPWNEAKEYLAKRAGGEKRRRPRGRRLPG